MKVKIIQDVDAFYESEDKFYTLFDEEMYLLNDVTKEILLFLKNKKETSSHEIVLHIKNQYDQIPNNILQEIQNFLIKLENEKIVIIF